MKQMLMSNVATQVRGVSYKPEDLHSTLDDDAVILLRANNIDDGLINFDDVVYVDKKKVSDNQFLRKGDILICASSGSRNLVGKAAQVNFDGRYTFGAFCKVVRPTSIRSDYLALFFQSKHYRNLISSLAQGANINNIKNDHIDNLSINMLENEETDQAVTILNAIQAIVRTRKTELQKLDDLVKARFVEMFGDPALNNKRLKAQPMTEICDIIDGDRGKNYPTADEFSENGYCLFLNAKNVTSQGFNFDVCMFITEEKDSALRKGKLKRGDVVLTTRGTIGNLAFYTNEIPFENVRINSGMVILRMKRDIVDEVFFIQQFRMQLSDIKEKIASGSAQPQLPISTMNKIQMLLPEYQEQKQFAAFVQQVDKSKAVVQKALDEAQVLFDSLMQEYFG